MMAKMIARVRNQAGLSQEQFAALLGVSRQAVQKWESGASAPELDKLIRIAKQFDVSLDALALGSDRRITEELKAERTFKPQYAHQHGWEVYAADLMVEWRQCQEEGLDLAAYGDVFAAVARLPMDEHKKRLGDVLFDAVCQAKTRADYPYREPSTLPEIRALRQPYPVKGSPASGDALADRIHGAWLGRICGCLLGKTVEGIRTDELIPFLKETGNWPMHRYIRRSDLNEDVLARYKFRFASRCYADEADGMPPDDDTNYIVLAQQVIAQYGRDFTPYDMSRAWLALQPKDAYCTAERVAFCNFVKGYEPPASAQYKNPYREWIGAQIRGDYFGWINPGSMEEAADMAFRDASISHVKNGIYGEMWVSAMLAAAACTQDMAEIIRAGLGQIPHTSRLHEAVTRILTDHANGMSRTACFAAIHTRWNEYDAHDWCHTISNAEIVAASLLYGGGDYGRSICMAVETGFDTDCNGATVGSVIGMAKGTAAIGEEWTKDLHDTLYTSIFGVDKVRISERAALTLTHLAK